MIIFVGDSRVRNIEGAFGSHDFKEAKPIFLPKAGARIPVILEMLKDFKKNHQEVPVMIVIIGMVGDILEKKTDGKAGYPLMKVRAEAWNKDKVYPAVDGSLQMRWEVEEDIGKLWPEVKITWVLPFPIDLGTYIKSCATKQVPRHAECAANIETLKFNNYMSMLDKFFQKEKGEDVIPWFNFWKDVANPRPSGTPDEFHEFMKSLRNGDRVPSLYPESSLDGLHPQMRTSQGLIRAVLRKYRLIVSALEKESKPITEKEMNDPAPLHEHKAIQADLRPITVRKSDTSISIILPCKHSGFCVKAKGAVMICHDCGVQYLQEELECEVTYCQKIQFVYKSDMPRSSTPVSSDSD